jgi:hypothetical protein
MAADPLDVRIAHLEGGYEQMDKRMASLENAVRDVRSEVVATRAELKVDLQQLGGRIDAMGGRIDAVGGRIDTVIYGVIVAILVPIFLRVFFH